MEKRLEIIQKYISNIEGVGVINSFVEEGLDIKGRVRVDSNNVSLEFDVVISPYYPLKNYDSDAIEFHNEDLLEYGHVMGGGSICIHTSHSSDLETKLQYDFAALKRWITKYYISKEQDSHYEHVIVPSQSVDDFHDVFLFTDVDYEFTKYEFGYVHFSTIGRGSYYKSSINSYIVQSFRSLKNGRNIPCKWSNKYKSLGTLGTGIFIFVNTPPALHNKFILSNWEDLEPYVNQEFLKFLNDLKRKPKKRGKKADRMPLFFGYKIPNGIHWQVASIETRNFPNDTVKEQGKFMGYFEDRGIDWMKTENCSYKYFFGRGTLTKKLTHKKILIIGLGAIGSILATTLVRGGSTQIDIVDFDIKEPGNVCRSEYHFFGGVTNKEDELSANLSSISPFVEIGFLRQELFEFYTKALRNNHEVKAILKRLLSNYDFIFDCSTDNDLMYVLNQLELPNLITMSVTNHAKELVCAAEPNAYSWGLHQFENVLENDIEDLHNPTGCWSPTFKASYNDINVLVQYAIKHINTKILQNAPIKNFVLETDTSHGFNIKLKEF